MRCDRGEGNYFAQNSFMNRERNIKQFFNKWKKEIGLKVVRVVISIIIGCMFFIINRSRRSFFYVVDMQDNTYVLDIDLTKHKIQHYIRFYDAFLTLSVVKDTGCNILRGTDFITIEIDDIRRYKTLDSLLAAHVAELV